MMKPQQFKPLCLVLSAMLLTACYPTYKTLQPEINVTVQDEQGRLLDQVAVVLARVPNYGLGYRYTLDYTEQGRVHFEPLSEWRVEHLMMHGVVNYHWSLCIDQAGYEIQDHIAVEQKQMKVILKKADPKAKKPDSHLGWTSIDHCDQLPRYEDTLVNQRE